MSVAPLSAAQLHEPILPLAQPPRVVLKPEQTIAQALESHPRLRRRRLDSLLLRRRRSQQAGRRRAGAPAADRGARADRPRHHGRQRRRHSRLGHRADRQRIFRDAPVAGVSGRQRRGPAARRRRRQPVHRRSDRSGEADLRRHLPADRRPRHRAADRRGSRFAIAFRGCSATSPADCWRRSLPAASSTCCSKSSCCRCSFRSCWRSAKASACRR